MEKVRTKVINNNPHSQQPGKGYPQQPPYQRQYYSQPQTPQYPPSTSQQFPKATTKAMGSNGTKEARKVSKFPVHQINDNDYTYFYDEDNYSWDSSCQFLGVRNGSQREAMHQNRLGKVDQQSQVL
eukprot:132455-Amphidinium_carterae.1